MNPFNLKSLAFAGLLLSAQFANALPLPIRNGVLTGPLNANGQAITDVAAVKFADGTTQITAGGVTSVSTAAYATNAGYAAGAGTALAIDQTATNQVNALALWQAQQVAATNVPAYAASAGAALTATLADNAQTMPASGLTGIFSPVYISGAARALDLANTANPSIYWHNTGLMPGDAYLRYVIGGNYFWFYGYAGMTNAGLLCGPITADGVRVTAGNSFVGNLAGNAATATYATNAGIAGTALAIDQGATNQVNALALGQAQQVAATNVPANAGYATTAGSAVIVTGPQAAAISAAVTNGQSGVTLSGNFSGNLAGTANYATSAGLATNANNATTAGTATNLAGTIPCSQITGVLPEGSLTYGGTNDNGTAYALIILGTNRYRVPLTNTTAYSNLAASVAAAQSAAQAFATTNRNGFASNALTANYATTAAYAAAAGVTTPWNGTGSGVYPAVTLWLAGANALYPSGQAGNDGTWVGTGNVLFLQ
jgi:hypothetical protein